MKKILLTLFTLSLPLQTFALTLAPTSKTLSKIDNADDLLLRIVNLADAFIYILISFAVIYIIWYVVIYFIKGDSGDESRKEAGMHILWGIVGLAIILSVWGLVNILLNTFSTNNNVPVDRIPPADFINED